MIRIIISVFILSAAIFSQALPTPKIEYKPKHYISYKSDSPILIDGKLDDGSWENAQWTDLFIDIEGNLKPKPFFDTKVKMLWDDNYFYFGAFMEEPHVWATITARDAVIFKDNAFKMNLAANLAGRAISIAKTNGPHAASYPFTTEFGINHGHAVSLTINQFMILHYLNNKQSVAPFDLKKRFHKIFKILKVKNIYEFDLLLKNLKPVSVENQELLFYTYRVYLIHQQPRIFQTLL